MELPNEIQPQEQEISPDASSSFANKVLVRATGGLLLLSAGCSAEAELTPTVPTTFVEVEAGDSYTAEDMPTDPSGLAVSITPETSDGPEYDHALNDAYFDATVDAIEDGDLEAAEEAASGINLHASQDKDRDGDGVAESAYTETQNALNGSRR